MRSAFRKLFSRDDTETRPVDLKPGVSMGQQHRCFVVEDDSSMRALIKRILHPYDISIWEFNTAQTALDAVRDHNPELILLDVSLEGSDAIDVIRGLADQQFRGVVQIITGRTGSIPDTINAIGERYGLRMRSPLRKPLRAHEICSIIIEEGLSAPILSTAPISLAEALEKNWLELWYQPKIDLRTKILAGVEGFVRANHPVHGMTAPSAFLKTASKADLAALNEFAIMSAMVDWASFYQAGFRMKMAINIPLGSLETLMSPNLLREIRPKSPDWPGFVLDVNAGDIARNLDLTQEVAAQLSLYDTWIAIDDFHPQDPLAKQLGKVLFCELKLDKKYVFNCATDASKRKLCEDTIALAHRFGKLAVAEGVANKNDMQVLQDLGCDSVQGDLFSPPLQKERLIPILEGRQKKAFEFLASRGRHADPV
jgi:EAL domain-containing protein (putative c-di-GMP-specific phosphodiesterase class I)